jgi:hypothetical protein
MHAMIELAEYRRQDILAEAARYRLADQARPTQPLASLSKVALWSAMQNACASVLVALDARSFHTLRLGSKKSVQTTLTLAH